MLVGTVIVALAAGMLTMVRATQTTAEEQRLQAALASFTESLRATDYLPCGDSPPPTPGAYETAHEAQPGHWDPATADGVLSAEIIEVEHWVSATPGPYGAYEDDCPSDDEGRQLLTVRVELDGGREGVAQVVLSDRTEVETGANP